MTYGMKFRIISDLHIDINRNVFEYNFDPEAFYLIAGDTSGDRYKTCKFLKENVKQGVFVCGNHMGYEWDQEGVDNTKESCYVYLAEQFPLTDNVSFLDNDYKEIGDDIIVVGCTLYTDFNLFDNVDFAKKVAGYSMNDFRYVKTYSTLGGERLITPDDYAARFYYSLNYITEVCEKFPDKKIIVVTHHGPSPKSLTSRYVQDILSAAYVSNLRKFLLKHKNIKLWCHGHVHNKAKYKIGQTTVICHPLGYYNEGGIKIYPYLGREYEL